MAVSGCSGYQAEYCMLAYFLYEGGLFEKVVAIALYVAKRVKPKIAVVGSSCDGDCVLEQARNDPNRIPCALPRMLCLQRRSIL